MIRSLLYANTFHYIPTESTHTAIESLRQRFIIFPSKNERDALGFCREALLLAENHSDEIKNYIIHLYHRFFEEPSSSLRFVINALSCAESKEALAFLINIFTTELGMKFPGENNEEVLRNLLSLPNSAGNTALYYAKNAQAVRVMIQAGASVTIKNAHSETPLHVLIDDPTMVKVLIEEGADIHAQDMYGYTPLHRTNHPETAKLLIEHGAKVDASTPTDEERPLH